MAMIPGELVTDAGDHVLNPGRRTLTVSPAARPRLVTPREVAQFLLPQFGAYPVERFGLLLLDARLRLIDASVADLDPWQAILISIGLLVVAWLVYDGLCRVLADRPS